ncbi:uncharacterized protein LOC142183181 [Leptodactylus fuscus]|uniref:uncharacterized protein LOC142183181 n=1 Tax=Leptodactylus fuscus TaxID=238119 RepID=UPI003F4F2220
MASVPSPTDLLRMDKDKKEKTKRILSLTLEIICLLTGEDYTIVKKTSGECTTPDIEPLPNLSHGRTNEKKILELTNKILDLLTEEGEDYLRIHKDIDEDVTTKSCQTLTSQDKSFRRSQSEICPSPGHIEECEKQKASGRHIDDVQVSSTVKENGLFVIKVEATEEDEMYLNGGQKCKEESANTDVSMEEGCSESSSGHPVTADSESEDENMTQDSTDINLAKTPPELSILPSDPSNVEEPPDKRVKKSKSHKGVEILPSCQCGRFSSFSCSSCGTQGTTITHEEIKKKKRSFSCGECSKTYTHKSHLVQHQRVHTGEKPYPCNACDKCFSRKSHLVEHQRTHTGKKPFSCSECAKCFSKKSNLIQHKRSHTGEKPFSCSECGRCFTVKGNLERHQRTHRDERLFSCSECGRFFSQKSHLLEHQRIHTGEKAFPCLDCGKGFNDKSDLVKHQTVHLAEQVFQIPSDGILSHRLSPHNLHMTMVLSPADPSVMDEDKNSKILNLTLEIIFVLTGEDYTVVKKTSDKSEGYGRIQIPIKVPPSETILQDRDNEQKILELTNKIIELLSGEREDYFEGHKDRFKEEDVVMDDQQPVTSPDESSDKNTPERCPQDCPEENGPEENQEDAEAGNLFYIRVKDVEEEEMFVVNDFKVETEAKAAMSILTEPERRYSCELCCKSFTRKSHLVEHQKTHTGEKPFICSECGDCFTLKGNLERHKRIHRDDRPYQCLDCGKCFFQKSDLVEHHRTHTGEKPYACIECGKCFIKKSALVKHQKTHITEKPFSCLECGKRFSQNTGLTEHQKIHRNERPFTCSYCGKSFTQKGGLAEHQRIHTGEKLFSCSECGKSFTKNSALIIHQRFHTGEKPFICSVCEKGFTQKSDLVKHLRIHSGEKPYSCTVCGKSFTQKPDLVEHMRIHTGEKPYTCMVCGRSFTHRSNFVKHQVLHSTVKSKVSLNKSITDVTENVWSKSESNADWSEKPKAE